MRLALLTASLFAALASAAVAQSPPPDERVAAQAMADATVRFAAAVDAKEGEANEALERSCRAVERRVPRKRRDDLLYLRTRYTVRAVAAILRDDFAQLRTDLANAQTRDPALLSGRAAWRQLARAYGALPPAGDLCAELQAWVRKGAPRAEGREALTELNEIFGLSAGEYERKVKAAVKRMIELGVPQEQAETFAGDDEPDAGAASVRPRSPIATPRPARRGASA